MKVGGGELVTTDKPAIVSEPFLDTIMVEDDKSYGCLPDSPWTDESDWGEIFREIDNPLNKLVTSETGPRWRRRRFSRRDTMQGVRLWLHGIQIG